MTIEYGFTPEQVFVTDDLERGRTVDALEVTLRAMQAEDADSRITDALQEVITGPVEGRGATIARFRRAGRLLMGVVEARTSEDEQVHRPYDGVLYAEFDAPTGEEGLPIGPATVVSMTTWVRREVAERARRFAGNTVAEQLEESALNDVSQHDRWPNIPVDRDTLVGGFGDEDPETYGKQADMKVVANIHGIPDDLRLLFSQVTEAYHDSLRAHDGQVYSGDIAEALAANPQLLA
jgi:hypothetical protein